MLQVENVQINWTHIKGELHAHTVCVVTNGKKQIIGRYTCPITKFCRDTSRKKAMANSFKHIVIPTLTRSKIWEVYRLMPKNPRW